MRRLLVAIARCYAAAAAIVSLGALAALVRFTRFCPERASLALARREPNAHVVRRPGDVIARCRTTHCMLFPAWMPRPCHDDVACYCAGAGHAAPAIAERLVGPGHPSASCALATDAIDDACASRCSNRVPGFD